MAESFHLVITFDPQTSDVNVPSGATEGTDGNPHRSAAAGPSSHQPETNTASKSAGGRHDVQRPA